MIQNSIILLVLVACAWFIGRRLYRTLRNAGKGGECSCSCSGCDPKTAASCTQRPADAD